MDERLLTVLAATGGVLTCADAARVDVSPLTLQHLVRSKKLLRVRRDAYLETQRFMAATPDDRYRLRARAILRTRGPGDALSHHAAVLAWGVDTYRLDQGIVDVASPSVTSGRLRAGLRIHPLGQAPTEVTHSVRVVPLGLALAHVALTRGVLAATCSIDNALFRGTCSKEDVAAAIELLPSRGRSPARRALALADPHSESVGETRARVLLNDLGYAVQSQVTVCRGPRFLGRVDFLVEGCVVVEFDGLVKYAGADGREALALEKQRESGLTSAGLEVERLVWSDLDRPAPVDRRIRAAVARARARGLAPDVTMRAKADR